MWCRGAFGKHCPFYQVVLWCSFFFSLPTWVACGGGHHYWIIFKHEARWPPRRSFIYFSPLSNFPRDHRVGPPSCVFPSLANDIHIMGSMNEITHTFDHLLTQLALVRDLSKHRNSSRLHFGHKWFTHFRCVNGFSRLCHAFFGWSFI
jgi:hypothetical protein